MAKFERILHHFDKDNDGKISPFELQSCMKSIGEELSYEDAMDLVMSIDSNGDGLLELEELVKMLMENEEGEDKELREAFKMYGMDGEDCITAESLMRMLARLGNVVDVEECRSVICRFDLDGDGVISFDEFRLMMMH
ncbi:uncharacterized protein A4U43_C07F36320 [Asparagus officinalis]|uniref:EF-hand domain-containing protein n=1 Tax=Asparagus officinalis TaxID=4686 RepID=A0A5P1ELB4_ASPOF|nr:putative calcium-binding protein CML19 [Asparagus officinalis]ONK65361.1 uncharacterized protein A4U43_C07F36320 [Asparagus officinalis]